MTSRRLPRLAYLWSRDRRVPLYRVPMRYTRIITNSQTFILLLLLLLHTVCVLTTQWHNNIILTFYTYTHSHIHTHTRLNSQTNKISFPSVDNTHGLPPISGENWTKRRRPTAPRPPSCVHNPFGGRSAR